MTVFIVATIVSWITVVIFLIVLFREIQSLSNQVHRFNMKYERNRWLDIVAKAKKDSRESNRNPEVPCSKGYPANYTKIVAGKGFTVELKVINPRLYYENYDKHGRGKDTGKYIDELIKTTVVAPKELAEKGLAYFEARNDVGTATRLMETIENFLADPWAAE